MKEIDHEDEQSTIKWDSWRDINELLANIADGPSNYKEHLRLTIRIIAKQHSIDAHKQINREISKTISQQHR